MKTCIKLLHGDCLDYLKKFRDNYFDLILTDSPYFISKEVVIHRSMNPLKYKYVGKDIKLNFGKWDLQWKSKEEYRTWCFKWIKECFRILRKGGHFISFIDKFDLSYFVDFAKENNMIARQCLFWLKTNPVPRARKVNFMEALEMMVWFTKETTSRNFATFNYNLGQSPNYFFHCIVGHTTKTDGKRIHPTQKPVRLCQWIIRYLSNEGDIILDPFCGSGTTLIASYLLNRYCIGIEKDDLYYKEALKRIEKYTEQERLF